MRSRLTRTSLTALAIVALTFSGTAKNAAGQQETVLYSFGSSGNDGQSPAVLTFDASGDIYGTTNLVELITLELYLSCSARPAEAGARKCCITSTQTVRTDFTLPSG